MVGGGRLSWVLALDKRFLDPRRTLNPSQAEKEEGIIPLTDSLPIISQLLSLQHRLLTFLNALILKVEDNSITLVQDEVFASGVEAIVGAMAKYNNNTINLRKYVPSRQV
ncbi:hypothetical protein RIF29_24248 [Crotalaria pallida]|uniref:ER membrane protein complex subunit 1 n=1 Tax=Crotalaria pallida TaxID=3830 RepID=A0AAN9EK68_CROPI